MGSTRIVDIALCFVVRLGKILYPFSGSIHISPADLTCWSGLLIPMGGLTCWCDLLIWPGSASVLAWPDAHISHALATRDLTCWPDLLIPVDDLIRWSLWILTRPCKWPAQVTWLARLGLLIKFEMKYKKCKLCHMQPSAQKKDKCTLGCEIEQTRNNIIRQRVACK